MKAPLTATLIAARLNINTRPVYGPDGSLRFEPATDRTPFIIFDAHRDAPTGFGVKIGATRKTFLIQRRVGKKVIKAKVGDVADFASLDAARDAARTMLARMRELEANPNTVERERVERGDINASELTLAQAFDAYRHHLVSRSEPAKASSLKNLDQAIRRLARPGVRLLGMTLGGMRERAILQAFDKLAAMPRQPAAGTKRRKAKGEGARTATEQAFRWCSTAVGYVLMRELREAAQERRQPTLTYNPFLVLKAEERFRSRKQLEKAYEQARTRNPLSATDGSLGAFLETVWQRRCETPNNRTAADYLLLTLLWGTRRGEAAPLRWRQLLTDAEAKVSSWVDLEERLLYLHDTKNHDEHRLPLADGAMELLRQRWEDRDGRRGSWVFPARSRQAKQGHYLDSKAILAGIRADAGIKLLRTHDLRRTFGAMAEEHSSYLVAKHLLNHRSLRDPTRGYTKVEWHRLAEAMQRIELAMLSTSPRVHTAILGHQATAGS